MDSEFSNHSRDCENQMIRLFSFALLTATLLIVSSCEWRGRTNAGSNNGTIIVGYYVDLTGRTSNFGQSTKNGVEMAVDEINKSSGIDGRQIRVISEDDE